MHLSPKERFGYAALGAMLLVGFGFVAAQRLRRPATIELHNTGRPAVVVPPSGQKYSSSPPAPSASGVLIVHVIGAVRNPGLVSIPAGSRVYEAISAAGGTTQYADTNAINLAAKVADGTQISVPSFGVMPPSGIGSTATTPLTRGRSMKRPDGPVDLNSASVQQLQSVPGIGPTMAQRIVDYRSEHGAFQTVDDLKVVQGFGKHRVDQVRNWLIVQ